MNSATEIESLRAEVARLRAARQAYAAELCCDVGSIHEKIREMQDACEQVIKGAGKLAGQLLCAKRDGILWQRRYEEVKPRIAKLEAIIAAVADEMSEAEEIDTEDWQRMLRAALHGEKADG